MEKETIKQILTSILIGACVAFLSTLFDGLSHFLQTHAAELIGGSVTSFHYLAKKYSIV